MKTTNFCKKMGKPDFMKLYYYGKRLHATEMIIHKNGSIDLYENNNCICLNYFPTSNELNKKYNPDELTMDDIIIYNMGV